MCGQKSLLSFKVIILSILLLSMININSPAQEKPIMPEISGFGDVVLTINDNESDDFGFNIGQLEVDFAAELKPHIQAEIAIAYDGEDSFEIGAFIIDFHLLGSDEEALWHYHKSRRVKHSGVMVGQFDVPFGIDWMVYPSIDRQLVSIPQAVEFTHNEWNDIGVNGYLQTEKINAAFYIVNGFEYDADPLLKAGSAVGGRFGVTPNEQLEIGGSMALLSIEDSNIDMTMLGVDAQFSNGDFTGKGELIAHMVESPAGNDITNFGYYIQGLYDFGPLYGVARIGMFSLDEPASDDNFRLSLGGGRSLAENCWLRLEFQVNSEEDNAGFVQMAVGF